jgi:MoaA/NifB/PqqE/SkfB family radical SAM enzyme
LRFEINITDHCNLNCKGCSHYSPLAKPSNYDIDILDRDFKRLSKLTNRKIGLLKLIGGEPMLHPQLLDILFICRKYFEGRIFIYTNGTLLLKQPAAFWQTCRDNQIDIEMSVYPIKIDIEEIKTIARNNGVDFKCLNDGKPVKWYNLQKDLSGKQNSDDSWENCNLRCVTLDNGKLYGCGAAFVSKHFNSYFGTHFKTSEKNYIDIYKVKTMKEIQKFLSKSIPFCSYCRPKDKCEIEWGASKKEITEWT